jgi:hypothetical protein
MPFEITSPGGYIHVRLFGVFTAADLNQLASDAEVVEDESPVSEDRVTDLTAVELFEVGFSAIYSFAARRQRRHFSRTVKSAIIVDLPIQFGLARIYQTLNANPQIEVRLVRSMLEAQTWFAETA